MGRRKKKKDTKPKLDVIQELLGFKLGDKVWAIYLDKKVICGVIEAFYPKNKEGPVASIMTIDTGYRIVLLETMQSSSFKLNKSKDKSNKK
jgi:hypothetical protein